MTATFVRLNEDSIVVEVIALDWASCGGYDFPEGEGIGRDYLTEVLHLPGNWMMCDIDGVYRVRYPSIGMTYDAVRDAFYWGDNPRPDLFIWDDEVLDWREP
jgi:hypothetical protein